MREIGERRPRIPGGRPHSQREGHGVLKSWRAWVLLVLLVGPVLAYLGFGALWLAERGWLLYAGLLWLAAGTVFAFLASRWTKSTNPILPPLDWDSPQTFTAFDRQAWELVEAEAEQ